MSKRGLTVIADGYTCPFFIRAVEGLHGALSGERRPMLVEHRDRIYTTIRNGKSPEYNQMIRTAMAAHVLSWDAADAAGNALVVNDSHIRHLQPTLYDKLYGIVCGDRPSDLPEDATDDDAAAFGEELRRAAEVGKTVGAAAEEADRKNSSAG